MIKQLSTEINKYLSTIEIYRLVVTLIIPSIINTYLHGTEVRLISVYLPFVTAKYTRYPASIAFRATVYTSKCSVASLAVKLASINRVVKNSRFKFEF